MPWSESWSRCPRPASRQRRTDRVVTVEPRRFKQGELFEWRVEIGRVQAELLAEIEIAGTTLHLRDVAIYPAGPGRVSVGACALLSAARKDLLPFVKEAGFQRLRITGTPALGTEARA